MDSNHERARARLVTSRETGGVTVRMKPEGLHALAARGDVERLRRQIPYLHADQVAELLELLDPAVRVQLADLEPASPRDPHD